MTLRRHGEGSWRTCTCIYPWLLISMAAPPCEQRRRRRRLGEQGRTAVPNRGGRTPRPSGSPNSHPPTQEEPNRVVLMVWVGDPLVRPALGPSILHINLEKRNFCLVIKIFSFISRFSAFVIVYFLLYTN
jgi:hypothetical protein